MTKLAFTILMISVAIIDLVTTQQSLVVVTQNTWNKPILDPKQLNEYMKNNSYIKKYMVDIGTTDEETHFFAKKLLENANVDVTKLNSFITSLQELMQILDPQVNNVLQVSPSSLTTLLLSQPKSIIYFTNMEKNSRIRLLQQQQQNGADTNSTLFKNMTPATFSGLFVFLFLLVVILIGISCLYDIKTNDKFLTNNLFVGKQS